MIKTENLNFSYQKYDAQTANPVLHDINTQIQQGEFVAILGRNGSGKSTLARHMNALLVPSEGAIWIDGKNSKDIDKLWEIRQNVGMVFQNPDNQIIATVVEEDVAFGPENLGVAPEEIRKRVDETLRIVGMSKHAKSAPHHLSGGQKQRVAIAGVLAMRAQCIVLDEPTAMLDPSGKKEVLETLIELNKKGFTIILITHFMDEAALANRIIAMHDGKVMMDDIPCNIFSKVTEMEDMGLTVPPITLLAHLLSTEGFVFPRTVLSIDEFVESISLKEETINITKPFNDEPCNMSASSKTPLVELRELSHVYNEGAIFESVAINNINLSIFPGEILGIIGHTGSGKSTLLQHINGLLKPTRGNVLVNGVDIHSDQARLSEVRQKIGLVFQYPEHQLFESTVFKDVAFGPTKMGLSTDTINEYVCDALATVGISEGLLEKSPFELSGGQKRRVAIAGVLAMKPDVLIFDEPTAGLDPKGKEQILSQIKNMHKNLSATIVLVSHNMDDAAVLCDRIVVMNEGRIFREGTPEYVFKKDKELKQIGLDVPLINQLFKRLKINGLPMNIFSASEAAKIITSLYKEAKI